MPRRYRAIFGSAILGRHDADGVRVLGHFTLAHAHLRRVTLHASIFAAAAGSISYGLKDAAAFRRRLRAFAACDAIRAAEMTA